MYIRPYVKYPLFLKDFNAAWFLEQIFEKNYQVNLFKVLPVRTELFSADRLTNWLADMTKLMWFSFAILWMHLKWFCCRVNFLPAKTLFTRRLHSKNKESTVHSTAVLHGRSWRDNRIHKLTLQKPFQYKRSCVCIQFLKTWNLVFYVCYFLFRYTGGNIQWLPCHEIQPIVNTAAANFTLLCWCTREFITISCLISNIQLSFCLQ